MLPVSWAWRAARSPRIVVVEEGFEPPHRDLEDAEIETGHAARRRRRLAFLDASAHDLARAQVCDLAAASFVVDGATPCWQRATRLLFSGL
jgi:hypothetical protein